MIWKPRKDLSTMGGYHSITLLSNLDKVLEKIVKKIAQTLSESPDLTLSYLDEHCINLDRSQTYLDKSQTTPVLFTMKLKTVSNFSS